LEGFCHPFIVHRQYAGYVWDYTYDGANQMTRERQRQYTSGSVVGTTFDQQYTFDEAGNRLTRTGSGTGYEEFDATGGSGYNDLNQLVDYTIDGGDPIYHTYDNGGRLTDKYDGSRIDWYYYWNADGTMARVQNNDDGTYIKYTYDWKGRRLEREDEAASSNGPKRRYYFVGLTPVAERVGSYIGSYSWSNDVFNTLTGGSIGQVLWRRTGGSTDHSLHYDHIGNVLAEANTSGVVTDYNEQDAYGRPILSKAAGWSDNTLHHTTKPWDDDIEMYYFNARWYDGQLGQFASPAPASRTLETPYGVSRNNPLLFTDPTGQVPCVNSPTCGGQPYYPEEEDCWQQLADKLPPIEDVLDRIGRLNVPPAYRQCMSERINDIYGTGLGDPGAITECRPNCDDQDFPTAFAFSRPGDLMNPGKGVVFCMDELNGCGHHDMEWILVHEVAHSCGMWGEGDWTPEPNRPWNNSGDSATYDPGYACTGF